jgi:hypothetical protein
MSSLWEMPPSALKLTAGQNVRMRKLPQTKVGLVAMPIEVTSVFAY